MFYSRVLWFFVRTIVLLTAITVIDGEESLKVCVAVLLVWFFGRIDSLITEGMIGREDES